MKTSIWRRFPVRILWGGQWKFCQSLGIFGSPCMAETPLILLLWSSLSWVCVFCRWNPAGDNRTGELRGLQVSPARGKTRKYSKKAHPSLLWEPPSADELLTWVKSVLTFSSPAHLWVFCLQQVKKGQSPSGIRNKTPGSTSKETGKHWENWEKNLGKPGKTEKKNGKTDKNW